MGSRSPWRSHQGPPVATEQKTATFRTVHQDSLFLELSLSHLFSALGAGKGSKSLNYSCLEIFLHAKGILGGKANMLGSLGAELRKFGRNHCGKDPDRMERPLPFLSGKPEKYPMKLSAPNFNLRMEYGCKINLFFNVRK